MDMQTVKITRIGMSPPRPREKSQLRNSSVVKSINFSEAINTYSPKKDKKLTIDTLYKPFRKLNRGSDFILSGSQRSSADLRNEICDVGEDGSDIYDNINFIKATPLVNIDQNETHNIT